jgi:hypothetical protein
VHVRLMTMGIMSSWVPCRCERSAFASAVYLSMMRWWVSLRLLSVHDFYSLLRTLRIEEYQRREEEWLTRRDSSNRMKSGLWAGGRSNVERMSVSKTAGQRVREEWSSPLFASTLRVDNWV